MSGRAIGMFLILNLFIFTATHAALPATDKPPTTAPSHVVAVTVYQGTALVTREVTVPAGAGLVEVVVNPLPAQTLDSSLFTEGADGLRVLSTRYRTRAVKEDTRAEVRAKEEQIKSLSDETLRIESDLKVLQLNDALSKLENFTSVTMQTLAEKGMLNGDATLALAKFVMDTRGANAKSETDLRHQSASNAEAAAFAQRELAELTAGANRTERDAVIVVDKQNPAAGTVRLNYLVSASTWRPQYKLRAGQPNDPVQVEYLAAIEQQSGEDWPGAEIVLSTAEPMLNAAPPFLVALDVSAGRFEANAQAAQVEFGSAAIEDNKTKSVAMRQQALTLGNGGKVAEANRFYNSAAALEQSNELLAKEEVQQDQQGGRASVQREGPSVTYHLKGKLTVPSRNDEQLIEVARVDLTPDYFYKAVPVLTPHVYRLANLTNTSEYVLLPGEATMYLGTDFVGRMSLPLVAIGEQFTAGFGVDPQIQVDRQLVTKSTSVQGGNQVHTFAYRIRVSSFKLAPVTLQVWDRLPHAESESVDVSLLKQTPDLSTDAAYLRADRPNNLLRWDLTVPPGANAEKAVTINYEFKLAYDRNVPVQNFQTK